MSYGGNQEANKCVVCDKRVYDLERVGVNNNTYHKWCFKCTKCQRTLSVGTYASIHGEVYCKPHFTQLFRSKGNYDEGFGKEQHKDQWTKKDEPTSLKNSSANNAASEATVENNEVDEDE